MCIALSKCSDGGVVGSDGGSDAGDAGDAGAGTNTPISPATGLPATSPTIAVDRTGRVMTAWLQELSQGSGDYVWTRRYLPDAGWLDAGVLSLAANCASPQVAVGADGFGVVAWIQSSRINAALFDADGGFSNPLLIETSVPNGADASTNVRVGADRYGSVAVVWERDARIYWNVAVDGGWATVAEVSDDADASATFPVVALHPTSGDVFFAFVRQPLATRSVFVRKTNLTTSGWSSNALRIDSEPNANVNGPRIAVDGLGNAIVVWEQESVGSTRIWYNRYTPDAGWGDAGTVSTGTTAASAAEIGVDGDGGAVAIWRQPPDGVFQPAIFTSGFNAAFGVPWSTAKAVSDLGPSSDGAHLALAPNGSGGVVWREDGTKIRVGLVVGLGVGSATTVVSGGGVDAPAVAANPSGLDGVHVVWAGYIAGSADGGAKRIFWTTKK